MITAIIAAIVLLAIVAAVILLRRSIRSVASKVDSLEKSVGQATRLAISAGARCSRLDSRCDGITNRITSLAKFNGLKSKPINPTPKS